MKRNSFLINWNFIKNQILNMLVLYLFTVSVYMNFLQKVDYSMPKLIPMALYFQAHNKWLASLGTIPIYLIFIRVRELIKHDFVRCRLPEDIILACIFFISISLSIFYELHFIGAGIVICMTYIVLSVLKYAARKKSKQDNQET